MRPMQLHTRKKRAPVGPRPAAARLVLAGEVWILLALCDFAARLNVAELAGSAGAILRMGDMGSILSASLAILCVAGLLLDYLERVYSKE